MNASLVPIPVALLFSALAVAESPRVPWGNDLAAAFRSAEESGRPVLVHVTANPCGYKAPIGNPGDVHETDCEALETRTLSTEAFAHAAARFVPLVIYQSSAEATPANVAFLRRQRVGTVPTLLLTDPWGNELIRMIGPTPVAHAARVLRAVPEDFAPLRAAALVLRKDPENLDALLAAAAFYERSRVGAFAERYYERAAQARAAKGDPARRRQVVIARGLNLLQMNLPKDAGKLFASEADEGLTLPQSDVILFGWAMASLAAGDRRRAESIAAELKQRFPDSPYTEKLASNLGH